MFTMTSRARLMTPGIGTVRFEGAENGADISLFWVNSAPGTGPSLHKHPYTETWVVLNGEANIQIADEEVAVSKGHILTVPAETFHRFENSGPDALEMLCIHASPVVIQEFIDDVAAREKRTADMPGTDSPAALGESEQRQPSVSNGWAESENKRSQTTECAG